MKKKRILLFLLAAALTAALDVRLRTVTYQVTSEEIMEPVRLAVVSDLHSCRYGEGQRTLLDAVHAQAPDAVLLTGDIVDDEMPEENAWKAVSALAEEAPCFYVTGNHEWWSGEAERICEQMETLGVTVLRGSAKSLTVGETPIIFCGVDDPESGEEQLEQIGKTVNEKSFTVLLAHRPERIEDYLNYPFDLIVSGHAHGGQWRLPGVLNGLLAPNQGMFPKYAGGRYDFKGTTFIVSRGLARESTKVPRIFNRPELVVIDVIPAEQ